MTVIDQEVRESERLREEVAQIARRLAVIAAELERLAAAGPEHGKG